MSKSCWWRPGGTHISGNRYGVDKGYDPTYAKPCRKCGSDPVWSWNPQKRINRKEHFDQMGRWECRECGRVSGWHRGKEENAKERATLDWNELTEGRFSPARHIQP